MAPGGKMIIPVGPSGYQKIMMINRTVEGKFMQEPLLDVRYVPLTSKDK
jgi:protein-L-isoaspartate O-methyltransferase